MFKRPGILERTPQEGLDDALILLVKFSHVGVDQPIWKPSQFEKVVFRIVVKLAVEFQ